MESLTKFFSTLFGRNDSSCRKKGHNTQTAEEAPSEKDLPKVTDSSTAEIAHPVASASEKEDPVVEKSKADAPMDKELGNEVACKSAAKTSKQADCNLLSKLENSQSVEKGTPICDMYFVASLAQREQFDISDISCGMYVVKPI